jgi:DNA-binding helix-hairpin-helix protein with protein kinase domain
MEISNSLYYDKKKPLLLLLTPAEKRQAYRRFNWTFFFSTKNDLCTNVLFDVKTK